RRLERPRDLVDLAGTGGLVGEVAAVAAVADERARAGVAEAEPGRRPQPQVEVVAHRVVGAVAAHLGVDAAVDHRGRVDQVVVAAHEHLHHALAVELRAPPFADDLAGAVDRDRVAVHDGGVRVGVEDGDLAAEPVGQGDVVVADARDQLAAGVLDDRVVRGGDAAVLGMGDDADARVVGIPRDHVRRRVGRGVVDDQELEVGVVLGQAALDRLGQVALAVVGGDGEGDAGRAHAARRTSRLARMRSRAASQAPTPSVSETSSRPPAESVAQRASSASSRMMASANSAAESAMIIPRWGRAKPSAAIVVPTTGTPAASDSPTLPLRPAPKRSGAIEMRRAASSASIDGRKPRGWAPAAAASAARSSGMFAPATTTGFAWPAAWRSGMTSAQSQRTASALGAWP